MKQVNIFENTIRDLENKFKGAFFSNFSEKPTEEIKVINSGSLVLDKALGIGGYPVGRIIEIYGGESCGKTTLSLQAIAECQKTGGKCVYLDLENALDMKYCNKLGVNTNDLIIAHPESGEQCFNIIESLIKTDMIDLIIVDSVAAMVPAVELESDMNDQTMGVHARIMSKGLRIVQNLLTTHETTIIFINQIREKIGVMFGNPETTTGGRALKFYSSVRIELRKKDVIKENTQILGIQSNAKIVKNKVAPPLTSALINIYFDKGIDHTSEIIDIAVQKEIVTKKGSWYYFGEEKIGQGINQCKNTLLENEEIMNKIKEEVLK
jgi:recombination protein RecA